MIEVSDSGLVSLMGGKWTSFRHMGTETVDRILKDHPELENSTKHDETQTYNFNLIGSYSRTEALFGLVPSNNVMYQQY